MADPRRYIGVRISEQGHRYVHLVAQRDRINYSEALRRLLALGARTDMEAHLDGRPEDRAGPRDHALHQREDHGDGSGGDSDGDAGSGSVPRVPDSGPEASEASRSGIGEAIGYLINAGFRPEAADPDSAA